jgi:hypothetical protein
MLACHDPDTRIITGMGTHYLDGLIRGPIVNYEVLEVLVSLPQDGIDCFANVFLNVVHRSNDSH